MRMPDGTIYCDNCGIEICWPVVISHKAGKRRVYHYCCEECASGQACTCSDLFELEDDRRAGSGDYPMVASGFS